ncbi:MAG: hypothetical protein Q9180_004789 [Flavoplaca navasiana]
MDQIYSQAYVTIVAAAGKSADKGLPGIGETPRKAQVEVKAHNCTFIEVPLALNTIRASDWATRGWTYQEAYLSPRRLLFTDVGVSYYCGSIHIEESVQQLLPKRSNAFMEPSEQHGTMEPSKEYGDLFRYRALPVHVGVPFSMETLIEHYTRRQLSYHKDSLNAFQGIASYHSHLGKEERTDNICGLPIVNGHLRLQWYHEEPAVRRPDFPSWSWAGWAGGVKFGSDTRLLPEDLPYPFLEPISVHLLPDLPRRLRDGSEGRWLRPPWTVETPKRLFVTGPVLALRLSNAKETERVVISTSSPPNDYLVPGSGAAPRYCMLECFSGIFAAVPIKLDSQTTIRGTLFGLMVTSVSSHKSNVDESYRVHVESIIVLEYFGWLYERVGYIDMNCAKWNGGRSSGIFVNSKGVLIDWHGLPWQDTNIKRPWLDEVERKQICLE